MRKVDFKLASYFPWHIMIVGVFLFVIGMPVLYFDSLIGGMALCMVGLVILTTHYRLQVDLDNKTYHDYLWIAGFKNGEKGSFNAIEYLFITKNKVKETMHLRVASSTIQKEVFDGYLKFSDQDKIHLLTLGNKERLISKLKSISVSLKTRIVDYSKGEPKEIAVNS